MQSGSQQARERLDIGIFVALLPPEHHGGAEVQAARLAHELAARAHRVQIFARRQRGRRRTEDRSGVRVHRRPVVPVPVLRSVMEILLGTAQAVRARPRVLLSVITLNSGLLGAVAGGILRVPFVLWLRLEGESLAGAGWLERSLAFWAHRRAREIWVQAETFIGTLEREYTAAGRRAAWLRVRPRVHVFGNGVDIPPAGAAEPTPPYRVVFIGRLTPQKDLSTLVDAARLVPECEVWIVGAGAERAALEERARGTRVQLRGEIAHDEIPAVVRACRALVLCSHREGVPNVVLEALANGRPVVANPVGAIRELIRDGVNGRIVPVGDASALAAALRELADEASWRALAGGARESVARCAWPRLTRAVEAQLAALVARRS